MVSDWVAAGSPEAPQERTDDFGRWQAVVSGVLAHAGVPGRLNDVESVRKVGLEDEDEWGSFLAALHRRFGFEKWTVKQVVLAHEMGDIEEEEFPENVAEKIRRNMGANKTLGWWLKNRADRWAGGLAVQRVGQDRTGVAQWRLVSADTDLL